jgi:hypothetical protein
MILDVISTKPYSPHWEVILAEKDFHLNDQFHHVVWMGDFGYTLVDTSGNRMPPESATHMLSDGRLLRTLFETHDQLNRDKRNQLVFFGYREPIPFPNFYPTYKKVENRPPANYSSNEWARNVYVTRIKDPFYYGGKVREWTPSFPDRILYYSMTDLAEDLIPESVPAEMNINLSNKEDNNLSDAQSSSNAGMVVQVDNYRSINDGEGMNVSEHSPVFATYILRLRHDFSELLSPTQPMSGISLFTSETPNGNGKPGQNSAAAKTVQSLLTVLSNHEEGRREQTPNGCDTPPEPTLSAYGEANNKQVLTPLPPSTPIANALSPMLSMRQSLLPHGIYRVRIFDIRMVWGVNEESPRHVGILFPAPYEAVAGERFVEYQSELSPSTLSKEGLLATQDQVKSGASMYSPSKSPKNNSANTSKSMRNSFRSPGKGGSSIEQILSSAALEWRRSGESKTGSCVRLESNCVSASGTSGATKVIPPLVLTWRGDEPLDRLHVCVKASMTSKAISAAAINGGNTTTSRRQSLSRTSTPSESMDGDEDRITGHCVISLEQLCKVALSGSVSVNGAIASTSVARLLVNKGRPMYNIDTKAMQREMVTFCCKLELLSS